MNLSEALVKRRTELEISSNRAAMRLEVTRPTYESWESGRYQPKPDKWEDVARYLGKTKLDVALMLDVLDLDEIRKQLEADAAPRETWKNRKKTAPADGRASETGANPCFPQSPVKQGKRASNSRKDVRKVTSSAPAA